MRTVCISNSKRKSLTAKSYALDYKSGRGRGNFNRDKVLRRAELR
jgi:hypothetical protein